MKYVQTLITYTKLLLFLPLVFTAAWLLPQLEPDTWPIEITPEK